MFVAVYITTSSENEAIKIGQTLVEERLVSCVNILPHMKSIYWWQGKIEHADEALMFAKTRQDLVKLVIERVNSLHSYITPAIVALPIVEGDSSYLDWIAKETGS